ncbi:MAG: acetyl-CoA carboxylase biotin carboxylase subunit [Candidatus Obscuribacterales bacterium]|nr:acetyl-CoA carboxylase biotin carboxylase subunit [Candidatus Obscuribacterales bacterium]
MFKKILIANRGEIAVRVIRACHELGAQAVAIFSEPDKLSRHVSLADESWLLEGQPGKVYLDAAQIIEIAKKSGAEAIHPGYGFLAENPEFAKSVLEAGLKFIGPKPDVILKMGSKVESRRIMQAAGVPVVPGTVDPVTDLAEIKKLCQKFGYPVAIKASAGGGGRGLRVVRQEEELEQALAGAQREGGSYFGNSEVYLEKYLERPRHIEVQIMADEQGNVVHLAERDCSSQRRHQKLLEEAPAAKLSDVARKKALEAAVMAAKAIGYSSAGTVEGLVDGDQYYFLEMNTRVQVEHPITEMITGIDIVKEQILVAWGNKLSFTQADVSVRGHAIECRINAEDPFKNFMPSPGTVHTYIEPSMPWVRVDSACYSGYQILPFYDSLLAKLVVWGRTREEAIVRMRLALESFKIEGVSTTIPFHLQLLEDQAFKDAQIYTTYVEKELKARLKNPTPSLAVTGSANGNGNGNAPTIMSEQKQFSVEVNQKHFKVSVAEIVSENKELKAPSPSAVATRPRPTVQKKNNAAAGEISSTMHGLIKQVHVKEGDKVALGQKLFILEAMKMESEILSEISGIVKNLKVKTGDTVEVNQLLVVLGE